MAGSKKIFNVVGAAIIDSGKLLVAQRPISDKAYKSLKWEFPGGKIEPGETNEEAITREIREELNCDVEVDANVTEVEHEYPDFVIRMTIFLCHLVGSSSPVCLEHNAICWMTCDELLSLDWAAADARCLPLVSNYLKKSNTTAIRRVPFLQ